MEVEPSSGAVATPDPRSSDFVDGFSGFLVATGRLDEVSVRRAQRAQRPSGERFDLVLSRLGLMQDVVLCQALAAYLKLPLATAADLGAVSEFSDVVPSAFSKSQRMVAWRIDERRIVVATADPFAQDAIAAVAYLHDSTAEIRLATPSDIEWVLERTRGPVSVSSSLAPENAEVASEDDVRRLKDLASEAPIIRLVNEAIVRAVDQRASDIHIEPQEQGVKVRFRIDGELRDADFLPLAAAPAIISRIKIMSRLNIAERRLPQDGRIKSNVRGAEIDLRVSCVPTLKGESVVLRILDRNALPLSLATLGFEAAQQVALETLLRKPNGIVLVTGPTGSGKTTTLYAALSLLNQPHRKLFTVEDPIEYQIAGINQVQVNPHIGLTFASALRSLLRQDPDVMMVGEIRDQETAEMAIQSALTGHLVLSTVHTNGAVATITRLLQMGVADYLLASTLNGVLAQRLVRCLCPACAVADAAATAIAAKLVERLHANDAIRTPTALASEGAKRAVGCPACSGTGFLGRMAISELLVVSDAIKAALVSSGQEQEIGQIAFDSGMSNMLYDGLVKVMSGKTTLEEVYSAVGGA